MSNNQLQPYQDAIKSAKPRFAKVAAESVDYDRECIFATQALMKNDFSIKTANNNPGSVHLAMINVASTGLTLNPANAYAYLVPRDGSILLDISYKGLIKIATDSGSILWARADIVYTDDTFVYHGPAQMPEHQADPFKTERGDVVGAYCIAKTKDGDVLTEVMPMSEIAKIRDRSMSYAKKKKGPWIDWFEQMAKKAVIKRACKTWPYTDRRLDEAVELANTNEGGYVLDNEPAPVEVVSQEQADQITARIEETESDRDRFLLALAPKLNVRGLDSITDIPASGFDTALRMIENNAKRKEVQA